MTTLKEEEPFAAAVKTVCLDTTCSHCFFNDGSDPAFRPPENVVHKCLGCHTVSYCDRKCQKSDWANHKNECRLLKQLNEKMKPIPEADVRLVARILLKSDEELATKAFNGCTWDSLENHATSGSPEFRNKIDSIIDFIKPLKTLSSEEVTKAFCKVATNRLDIIESRHGIGNVGIGIYLGLSVHKHNCLPDAQVIFNGTTASLRPFDEDPDYSTELTICRYSVTPWTPNRKDKLKNICFYECTCPLCTDDNHIVNRMGSSCHVSCCENAAGILDEIHPFPYRKSVDLSRRAGATSFPVLEHGDIRWSTGSVDGQETYSACLSRASSRGYGWIRRAGTAFGCPVHERGAQLRIGREREKHRPHEVENKQRIDENSSGPYRCNKCGKVSRITINDVKRAEHEIYSQLNSLGMSRLSAPTVADVAKRVLLETEKVLSVYNCHFASLCEIAIATGIMSSDHEMINSLCDKYLKALRFYVPETERHRATSLLKRAWVQTMFGKAQKLDTDKAIEAAVSCFGGGHPVVVEFKKFIFNYEMMCGGMGRMDISKFMGGASSSSA